MDKSIVFSKTGKGLLEGRQRSGGLSKELLKLLDLIDGKRALGELRDKLGFVDEKILQTQLRALQEQGLIRRASVPVADVKPLPRPARQQPADDDELDFTSPPTRPIAVVPPEVRASGAAVNSGRPPPAGPAEVIDRSANGPAGVSGRARERSIAKPGSLSLRQPKRVLSGTGRFLLSLQRRQELGRRPSIRRMSKPNLDRSSKRS